MKTSIKTVIDNIGLPLVVTSSKPYLCFLIDTGATHNIVFSYVYKELSDIFSTTQETSRIMGIEGVISEVRQVNAIISFEDMKTTTDFFVLDANNVVEKIQEEHGVQIHGILGIPFLTQNKWILDFNNLNVQC